MFLRRGPRDQSRVDARVLIDRAARCCCAASRRPAVAGSLAATLLAWHASQSSVEERATQRFDREAERVVDLFSEQLQRQVDVVQSTASLLGAREDAIGLAEWSRYHEGLDLPMLFPALDGIDVIHYVRADEVDAFVARQRIDYPDYELHPAHDQPFHLAIVHSSRSAVGDSIGFDMAHDEVRRDLIERTIRMGHAQITAPIDLTYSESPGFLMRVPHVRTLPSR